MSDIDEDYATPSGSEVFQAEDVKVPTVPVEIEGQPIAVKAAGGRVTGFRTFILNVVAGNGAIRILDDDPRRARATIIPISDDIRLGHTQGDANSSGGMRLPLALPLVIDTSDEVWACSISVGNAEVSVISEYWAR